MSLSVDNISIEINIDIVCVKCGNSLSIMNESSEERKGKRSASITVEPCETCLEERYEDGLGDERRVHFG